MGIETAKTENSQVLPNGNELADLGKFIYTDGTEGSLGVYPRIENLLRKSWFCSDSPIFFVKEPAIRLKKSKNLTQNSFPSLRFLFSDRLLGAVSGEVADINLIDNPFFREFTDTIPLTEETAELPDMQGSRKMLGFLPSPATYSDGTKIAQLSGKQIVKSANDDSFLLKAA